MKYNVHELNSIVNGNLLNDHLFPYEVSDLFFDTRRGNYGPAALFLAIDGQNADGHQYIQNAYQHLGTRNFLISKAINIETYSDANFILVPSVVEALQLLAIHHRNRYPLKTIGITGSNGKTIVKEWIHQLCESSFSVIRSPGSYNSQIGVPLSVLKTDLHHNLGLFEAGISGSGEMVYLEKIIQPQIGIFTNIGEAHSAGFQDRLEKIKEKLKLFENCSKIIYCLDHEEIHHELTDHQANLITWSTSSSEATYQVRFEGSAITINQHTYKIPFQDLISLTNATFAIITALELGIKNPPTGELKALKMRLEMKQGINNCFLINDSYTSDLDALSSALQVLQQQQKRHKNTLILSQIEESNLSPAVINSRLIELIKRHQIDRLITVGNQLQHIEFKGEANHFENTEELLQNMDNLSFSNENILIKGARRFNLERVFNRLSIKVHQTILEIDLEAMRHNLMVYRSLLKPETKLMVVLKASGYGSGSKELGRFLAYQRVDYIAVAYVDEGIELRKAGIDTPIMVMNPEESGFESMVKFKLEPEIYSLEQLHNFTTYVDQKAFPVHLKIETGMHRLGFAEADHEALVQFLRAQNLLKVATIFTHLVGSDDPELDLFSHEQVERFSEAYKNICKAIGYQPDRHILNSSGISRFQLYQFEMVRLGIGLHGLTSDQNLDRRLLKVQTLKTKIAQIKEVGKGESVGYNRMHRVATPLNIGTINIGYADGLPRNAGNENYAVLVNDKAAKILGNVCMDMCMIDLTNIDCKIGDEVIIFGKEWPIENLAKACSTIPYEILTRISTRVHRIFSRE
ncbi:bifunctional UDP-N-acetylmuramoyl-tripeptide:D-alanyl-D-alanine ligase/alanine racemase [Portibacter marinus]|uniref:bifunctional UDP-N-acetylmuramoyl-tripeptide:D-alanyl-D-alanine ligase/alanine racemase n=1 Tax=Portibacter marinus TaxID=2898660 RepID=UPI001F25E850|nr:bifunctional UDP-N-acetylmuramoyl-tripeptide:D-alanyl-D-alanine ligase/alanine racemase [Portibacter marinus]